MKFSESWGMLTGKIPKSQEYHEMTAKNQAHQVASQHDDPGGNIYNSFYQNAYNNSLSNNTPNVAAQNNGSGARPRSSFRNPQAGGLLSFFGGGSRLGDQPMTTGRFLTNFLPGVGLVRGLDRAFGNQPYAMNTQSGTGAYDPNKVNAMIAAAQTPQSANPGSMSRAAASGVDPRVAAATMQAATAPPSASAYSGLPADMEAQYSTSPAPLLAAPDVQLEAFTSQPSDPVYMQGGDFDEFVKSTMAFPDFDGIRDDRDLMMDVFEKYKAMHQGEN